LAERNRVLVGGLPGVGKTTILTRATAHIISKSKKALQVVFGTVMLEEAKKLGVTDRDRLRFLPVSVQRELQRKAAHKVYSIQADFVLIDTHFVIRTPEGFWPGLPIDVLRTISPTHIVMIQAPVDAILSRRKSDGARKRDEVAPEEIEQELELSRQFMVVASAETGAPMKVINNLEGKADDALNEFLSTIRAL
jgi:adenylate kinase